MIETYITVYTRKGYEYKWFCPSAFTYLIAIVPCIWLLELHESRTSISVGNQTKIPSPIHLRRFSIRTTTTTTTTTTIPMTIDDISDSNETHVEEFIRMRRALPIINKHNLSFEEILKSSQEFILIVNRTNLSYANRFPIE